MNFNAEWVYPPSSHVPSNQQCFATEPAGVFFLVVSSPKVPWSQRVGLAHSHEQPCTVEQEFSATGGCMVLLFSQ